MNSADLCREHGVSHATFYNWKAEYGGMDTSQLMRIRELEEELFLFTLLRNFGMFNTKFFHQF